MLRRNVLLLLLASLWSLTSLAQDAALTPEATPDAQLTTVASAEPTWESASAATATAIAEIEAVEHNVLYRPIELSDDKVHWVDRTYPYGSTQLNTRPVHLGVEFVNSRFTPVYAAKSGVVVYAGNDAATLLGPQLDYYGNVVVLAHDLRSLAGREIFTLYGHLDRVEVEAGELVDDLDRIGRIGSTGVAIGPHLHFEVRAENPYDYRETRNPELWLQHYHDRGLIIGFAHDEAGEPILGKRLVARSTTLSREVYTYGSGRVNGDPVWGENFVISDLPAGSYEIVVLNATGNIAYRNNVEVEAYRSTFVDITLSE